MKTKLNRIAAAAALTLTVCAPSAMAVPSQLYFQQSAGWVNPTTDAAAATFFAAGTGLAFSMQGAPLADPPYPAGTYAGMQWQGLNGAISSIGLASFTSTTSPTALTDANGQWNQNEYWVIDRLFQNNQVITANNFPNPLWVADTLANLRFFDDAVGGNQIHIDPNSPTRISFWETVNNAPCANPNPAGSVCNDIYTVLSASLADINFNIGADLVTVSFGLLPGAGTVICPGDPACTPASTPPAGQIAIYTPEGQNSEIFVTMAWSVREVQVPEPSIIGLFGAGLLGLGFAARRRLAGKKA
ncbi:MAG: THxN family PEP-CTERM protein [Burkholderiaceae bacterium]|nr:THxN family PEP-CTERM protein [Burkholderiaceae bacterium]